MGAFVISFDRGWYPFQTLARHAVGRCPCRHDANVLGPLAPFTEDLRHFLGACQQSRSHAVLFLVLARAAGLTAKSYTRDGPEFAQRRVDRSREVSGTFLCPR